MIVARTLTCATYNNCHLTQNVNYPALRTLYQRYRAQGFNILAFPCDQFGGQAPGTSQEQREAAIRKFGLPDLIVMDKLEVNGEGAHPLYRFLRAQQPVSTPNTRNAGGSSAIEWSGRGVARRLSH